MEKTRFSKQSMVADLTSRVLKLKEEFGFDDGDGWSQVAKDSDATKHHYGRYEAYKGILRELLGR